MTAAAPSAPSQAPGGDLVPAGLDRRFYAFVLDRLLLWSLYAAAAAGAYAWFLRDQRWLPGVLLLAGVVVVLLAASAAVLGRWGVTAGKAALGLRVVDVEDAGPIGLPRALLRGALLGMATLPTFGFGAAALAWTAVTDPGGRRRGWHDLRAGCWVVDAGSSPSSQEPPVEEVEPPRPVLNLTAMRLVPPPADARVPPPAPAGAPASPPPGRRVRRSPRWQVTFDTGERLEVQGLVLVGRRPEPRPGEPLGRLLALASSDMSLSKTHAQFQVVPDGALVVMDRGSTNGSVLVRAGLARKLEGGRPATLRHGDRVRFGDREMTVTRLDAQ